MTNVESSELNDLLDCPKCGKRMQEYQARSYPETEWTSMLQCQKCGTRYNKDEFLKRAV